MGSIVSVAALAIAMGAATAAAAGDVSIERGLQVSVVGSCHDCHTEGYRESEGTIDPEKALKGSPLGWRGSWGTSYALNLRLTVRNLSEVGFLRYMTALRTLPPMPWYNVRAMDESDLRSLYRYIKSLGEPGKQAPTAVGPDVEPTTPFVVLAPPQMPKGCSRDLDCGVGLVCGPLAQCVLK